MEAVAKLRNCPMSPRKMRLVVDNIRGKNVADALNILKFTNKEAAIWLEKLVRSVISNWEIKSGLSADSYNLYLKTAYVDGGTMMKRFQPAPQGRAHKIRKRTNHVTLIVENKIKIAETEETTVEA